MKERQTKEKQGESRGGGERESWRETDRKEIYKRDRDKESETNTETDIDRVRNRDGDRER